MSRATILVHLADQRRRRTDSHGIINFSVGLTRALPPALGPDERLVVLVNDELVGELEGMPLRAQDELEVVAAPATTLDRLRLDHVEVPRRARHADVVLFPKGFLPLRRRPGGTVQVPVIHDDIPLRMLRERGPLRRRARAAYFSGLLVRSAKVADARCFVSAFTAGRIQRVAGGARPGDVVVHEGITLPPTPSRPLEGRARQALLLGSHHAHKRLGAGLRLAAASAPLRAAVDRLVVLGPLPDGAVPAAGLPVEHRPGPLPGEELAELVASSRLLVYASVHEGFGLPPVEAFALGTPVVHRATPAAEEVLGDVPGRFHAEEQGAFDAAVAAALALGEADLEALRARMWATYDWDAVAIRVAAALRRARVGGGSPSPDPE